MSILRVYYSIIYRLCNTQHTSASTHPLLNADADVYFTTNADADAEADVQFITTADADADVKEYADVPRMRMQMRISDTSLIYSKKQSQISRGDCI